MKTFSYTLENLDCANCANKIERKVTEMNEIMEANVSFATKTMSLDLNGEMREDILKKVTQIIHEIEPDVTVIEKTHRHIHSQSCDCEHEEHVERSIHEDIKLRLYGLDCANCAAKIERNIQTLSGIEDATVNFSTQTLQVKLKSSIDKKTMCKTISDTIHNIEPEVKVEVYGSKNIKEEVQEVGFFKENYKLILGTICFIIAIYLTEESYAVYIYLISFLLIGGTVILTALRNILKGEIFDENFLMSVATIGAFLINDYAEAVTVMLFYGVGELCQSYAVNRSRKSISSLMDIRADYANLLVDNVEKKVDPEDVKINDVLLVKPGERIPLDGVLIDGNTSLDTSALTGESLPREIALGDEVLAGSVNLSGVIQLRVTKDFGQSTVSRILELVENASSKKAPMEKTITKFARVYTPIVVVLAILIAVLPPLFGYAIPLEEWIYRALTFLVVSCPCALVISIPLGLFAGIGGASKQGILIKGGNYLEALKDVDTVVFDKTGTLTKGSFKVMDIVANDKDELLKIAAYGEYYSNHPIAISIRKAFAKDIDSNSISNYEEIAGNGVHVLVDGSEVLLGNKKLMQANQIDFMETKAIGTIIHVAKDHIYLGYLVIADEVKETSAKAIQALKLAGVKRTVMLTGDRKEVADAVANTLHLDEVYAQLLPQDKIAKVEELLKNQNENKKLAFVGDGINDAPVLARADLGVAMGGIGSDAAIEAADIVLMKDDPEALAVAIQISHKTAHILWQNIALSLGIKVFVLILTALGFANMWMGVFADVGVTLIAILNSMRAMDHRSNKE